nr:immunoglobulin light chain junction region [Macaca mulatta]MOX49471.1 immunoglobulin light chain junction region [Macaca mulatta]MOX50093.1 immunoglobulin light chain junction region [Macaca mulatta]
CQQHNVYPRTF